MTFVFSFSLPLSLPFDWTFKILSMCLLFCFVCLSGCYVVMLCVKRNKKMLITKSRHVTAMEPGSTKYVKFHIRSRNESGNDIGAFGKHSSGLQDLVVTM